MAIVKIGERERERVRVRGGGGGGGGGGRSKREGGGSRKGGEVRGPRTILQSHTHYMQVWMTPTPRYRSCTRLFLSFPFLELHTQWNLSISLCMCERTQSCCYNSFKHNGQPPPQWTDSYMSKTTCPNVPVRHGNWLFPQHCIVHPHSDNETFIDITSWKNNPTKIPETLYIHVHEHVYIYLHTLIPPSPSFSQLCLLSNSQLPMMCHYNYR